MNKKNWMTIGLMTLLLGAAIPAMTGCKTSEVVANGSQTFKYTCPMHPEVVQGTPGNCPICGMALVETVNTVTLTTH